MVPCRQEEAWRLAMQPTTNTTSQLVVADEVELSQGALPGFPLDVIRIGVGNGPNITRSRGLGDVVITSRTIQFPIVARADVVDDRRSAVLITSAPEGSRWCEVDLESGTVLLPLNVEDFPLLEEAVFEEVEVDGEELADAINQVTIYGSGSEHTQISPVGLGSSFALFDSESLEVLADQLGLSLRVPRNGAVQALDPTPSVRSLAAVLNSRSDPLVSSAFDPPQGLSALHAVVAVLSETPHGGAGRRATINSRSVVGISIEYAESIHRAPSIAELCMVAHVSERRLRSAFTETVGMAPLKYFHYRLLNEARSRFIATENGHETVGVIALDLGFTHLGRFASRYQQLFGELPSATLSLQE